MTDTTHLHSPKALDVAAFCRDAAQLRGQWPLAGMARLVSGLSAVPADAAADWRLEGSLQAVTGGPAQLWLHLQGSAKVLLQCQRCLQDMGEVLRVDRRIRFVRGETEAARLDEESDDDVLALVPRLDLQELLEDELILGLPLVPRHECCPQPLVLDPAGQSGPAAEAETPHPFAALAALRGKLPKAGDA
jgi:uncharacterized protein